MLIFHCLLISIYLLMAYYVPDAGEIIVVKIHTISVLTELKIYVARQMGNKVLGSFR